jgi:hypothetical protein
VIGVAVAQDHRAKLVTFYPEHVHIVQYAVHRNPGVEEEGIAAPARDGSDKHRDAVLGAQLRL